VTQTSSIDREHTARRLLVACLLVLAILGAAFIGSRRSDWPQELGLGTAVAMTTAVSTSLVAFKVASPLVQEWLRNKSRRSVKIKSRGTEVSLCGDISDVDNCLRVLTALSQTERTTALAPHRFKRVRRKGRERYHVCRPAQPTL